MTTKPVILAAVDLNRRAPVIIAEAARLAIATESRLVVVHVVDYRGGDGADCPFPERPAQVRNAMVRHARASLVGMIASLDLPEDLAREEIAIRVETGPLVAVLAKLAHDLGAARCIVGESRLASLNPFRTASALSQVLDQQAVLCA